MRRYKDVRVQPGCDLDNALAAGDYARAERIYIECEREFRKHQPHFQADYEHSQQWRDAAQGSHLYQSDA